MTIESIYGLVGLVLFVLLSVGHRSMPPDRDARSRDR